MKEYKYKDKSGKIIKVGNEVNVPVPNKYETHQHPFIGLVTDIFDDGRVLVEDQDSDYFEIKARRLEII